ncbi:hypothetical protein WG66_014215 [Moniliophthora roreri]|nr:hypothetical protein WG66_014215 [Moniliophthora roreri]
MSTSGRREREAEEGSFNTQEEDAAEAQTVTQEGPHHTPGSRISKFRVKVNLPPISSVPLESQEGGEMEPEGRWDPYSASCCDGYINCWELVEESDEVFLGCRSSEDARSGPVGCFQCASGDMRTYHL